MYTSNSYKRNKFQTPVITWENICESSMTEIFSNLFLGSCEAVHPLCLPYLKEKGIRYFLRVKDPSETDIQDAVMNDPQVVVLTLDIENQLTENIIRFFNKTNTFIDRALSNRGQVLVYGNTGNSRSAVLVIAYIMQRLQWSASDTLSYITQKRRTIHINEAFKCQLREYEPIYKSLCGGGSSSNAVPPPRSKRRLDDHDNVNAKRR